MAADRYWLNTVVAMHFDGVVFDEKGHGIGVLSAQISATRSKFGGTSLYLPGTGLAYANVDSTVDLDLSGSDPFTIEFWVYIETQTGNWSRPLMFGTNGEASSMSMWVNSANEFGFVRAYAGAVGISASGLTPGTWHHVALCATGNVGTIFLNGATVATSTFDRPSAAVIPLYIGGDPNVSGQYDSTHFHGYLDDLRITKGVARYAANFTPPAEAFGNYGFSTVVGGFVKDHLGNLAERRIDIHAQETGELLGSTLSDPVTGRWSFPADRVCYAVAIDAAASARRAIVFDRLDPY